ncbi:hypothetical protein DY218_09655 [Streptomyces triticagri]|uniref:Uncharacterized protein n=1 Tax=Streptomyces triticagri TaxID=2293568 RepID=A0A372M7R8_9ACTN|nr:hypothetical protein DY218_09655 [Streptomyces triticagri]
MAFGAAASLTNALSSPYVAPGRGIDGTVWASCAKVLSLLLDAGWAWAALAVAMGFLAGAVGRGALSGATALIAATSAYYTVDVLGWGAGTDAVDWLVAGVPLGLLLGMVGAAARRPGVVGLVAALTVPVGAAVQMLLLPPRPYPRVTATVVVAEVAVWAGCALGAGWAVHRFWAGRARYAGGVTR